MTYAAKWNGEVIGPVPSEPDAKCRSFPVEFLWACFKTVLRIRLSSTFIFCVDF